MGSASSNVAQNVNDEYVEQAFKEFLDRRCEIDSTKWVAWGAMESAFAYFLKTEHHLTQLGEALTISNVYLRNHLLKHFEVSPGWRHVGGGFNDNEVFTGVIIGVTVRFHA